MLLFDGHLDLAMNAFICDRDVTWSLSRLRKRERGRGPDDGGGTPTVCLPEMRRAQVIGFVGTLFARAWRGAKAGYGPRRSDVASPNLAHALAAGQLAYYHLLHRQGTLRLVRAAGDLGTRRRGREPSPACIVLMEGADPITRPAEVEWWWQQGVRAVALTHVKPNRYAYGNQQDGPLSRDGRELLRRMSRAGVALDLSHLSDTSLRQARRCFDGRVFASHSNCRALVPGMRQLSDQQIRAIVGRRGVIGIALYNAMLRPAPRRGRLWRRQVGLAHAVDHIDHVCQLAGTVEHVAIGSDLDGGFGVESCPRDLDTIADLQKLGPMLADRGYSKADVAAIFHGNWLRFWGEALPMR